MFFLIGYSQENFCLKNHLGLEQKLHYVEFEASRRNNNMDVKTDLNLKKIM